MLQCGKYVGITGKNGELLIKFIKELIKEYHNTIGIFNLFISSLEKKEKILIHQIFSQQNTILVAKDCDRL